MGLERSGTAARALGLAVALLTGAFPVVASAAAPAPAEAESTAPACGAIQPDDLRGICERGELRVARYRGERPPFFFRQGDEWVGFDVDLGRDIAARLGVRYQEEPTAASFDEVVERVAAGDADLGISKLSATLERAFRVRFTRPYLTVYQALLVNRLAAPQRGDPFRRLDAPGFAIGALDGSAYVGYARGQFPAAEVRPYGEFAAMMGDLVAGRLDAALMDSARANTWRRGHSQELIRVRTTIDRTRKDPLAIAVDWRRTHLLAWLDLYLGRIEADGTAEALYRKWFGDAAPAAEEAGEGGGDR